MMAAKPEKGIWLRKLVLAIWGLICFLPILFFATIALRPRNEIIAPEPIYFPTLTIETWAKIMEPAAVAIPIFVLFGQFRILDTVWALMLVYAAMNLSIVVWIIRSYMLDIPSEIEDAARTDGASDLRILWSIIIPMCLPGIVTAAVIAAIFAMNEYLFTLIIASKNAYPLSVALANFSGGSDGIIYNAIALVSFMAFFPILLLVILIQNHLSRGLTMGAVKG